MEKFVVRDREAGNEITWFDTLAEAEAEIEKYEAQDKANDCFTEGFYEIARKEPANIFTYLDGDDNV